MFNTTLLFGKKMGKGYEKEIWNGQETKDA